MIRFAIAYPGAALPPNRTQRGVQLSMSPRFMRQYKCTTCKMLSNCPLVFVDPFNLHIEHRARIDIDPTLRVNELGEPPLVLELDFAPARLKVGIVCALGQGFELVQIGLPAPANRFI